MSIVIIDNFDGDHGLWVQDSAEEQYFGDIHQINLGSDIVSQGLIEDKLDYIHSLVESRVWDDVTAINISYGSGSTNDFTWANDDGWEDHIQPLWEEGVDTFLASGNYGAFGILGVSKISSSPFSWSIGADTEDGPENYTQWGPELTSVMTSGHNDNYNVDGTSFAAPTAAGVITTIREKYDANIPVMRTAIEYTANYKIGSGIRPGEEEKQDYIYQELDIDTLQEVSDKIDSGEIDLDRYDWINEHHWIDAAYEIFCGRQPDTPGMEYWEDKIINEDNPEDTLRDFISSADANNDICDSAVPILERVQAHYHLLLDREADMSGLGDYIDEGTSGVYASWEEFSNTFIDDAIDRGENVQFQGVVEDFYDMVAVC